jgi:signal transduction histidine kinase
MTLLAAGVALALAIPMGVVISRDQHSAFISQLQVDTLSTSVALSAQPETQWQDTAEKVGVETGARVVVVDAASQLIADSDLSGVDRSFNRPEITQALAGTVTSDERFSVTLGTDLRYVAAPVVKSGKIVAAVRLTLPEYEVTNVVRESQFALAVFVIAVMFFAALIAWLIARSIAAPLSRVAEVAQQLPDDLSLRADEGDGPVEVQAVSRALNITAERLTGILERTQAVAADASHHLKTPLTGVRLRLEAIEDISDQEDVRTEAVKATAEVDRLTHRIDQVLALARSDSGKFLLGRCVASIVIADRIQEASVIAQERGLTLDSSIMADLVAQVPAAPLATVIDELLGNAFDYAKSVVKVTLTTQGNMAVLEVEDDGPGLPIAEMEVVFNRFVRGTSANLGGSGLGLALVRETARSCGGDAIALPSELGGLSIRTTWPLAN